MYLKTSTTRYHRRCHFLCVLFRAPRAYHKSYVSRWPWNDLEQWPRRWYSVAIQCTPRWRGRGRLGGWHFQHGPSARRSLVRLHRQHFGWSAQSYRSWNDLPWLQVWGSGYTLPWLSDHAAFGAGGPTRRHLLPVSPPCLTHSTICLARRIFFPCLHLV